MQVSSNPEFILLRLATQRQQPWRPQYGMDGRVCFIATMSSRSDHRCSLQGVKSLFFFFRLPRLGTTVHNANELLLLCPNQRGRDKTFVEDLGWWWVEGKRKTASQNQQGHVPEDERKVAVERKGGRELNATHPAPPRHATPTPTRRYSGTYS